MPLSTTVPPLAVALCLFSCVLGVSYLGSFITLETYIIFQVTFEKELFTLPGVLLNALGSLLEAVELQVIVLNIVCGKELGFKLLSHFGPSSDFSFSISRSFGTKILSLIHI